MLGKQRKASLELKEKLASVSEICARLVERATENNIVFVEDRKLGWSGWGAAYKLKIICVPPEVRTMPLEEMQKLNEEGNWNIEADIAHEIAHIEIYELAKKLQKQGYRCTCNTPCMYSEELAVEYQWKLLENQALIPMLSFEKKRAFPGLSDKEGNRKFKPQVKIACGFF